jgi:hypothetical protein
VKEAILVVMVDDLDSKIKDVALETKVLIGMTPFIEL